MTRRLQVDNSFRHFCDNLCAWRLKRYQKFIINFLILSLQHSQLSIRLAAPHQLNPKPEADDLVFGKHFTDHMLKVSYHRRLGGWQKPEIMPLENLVLHPAAKVFHYAVEVSFLVKTLNFSSPCSTFHSAAYLTLTELIDIA